MADQQPPRPPQRPLLDKNGNPPPPRRPAAPQPPVATPPPTPAPTPRPMVDKNGNPPPPRRPRPQIPEPVAPEPELQPDQNPELIAPRDRFNSVSDRRTRPRPAPPKRPARALPRQDPATYQPVYVNKQVDMARSTMEWLGVLIAAVVVALVIKAYVVEAYEIPSGSMEPTLMIHDKVVVNKLSYDYGSVHYGDVIVFHSPPTEPDPTIKNLIKRVVGKPGDTLEEKGGIVYRNGQALSEPYLPPGTTTDDLPPTTVPPGQLFVMGDNRGNSEDSRYIGTIPISSIEGKAEARAWPLGRIALLSSN